MNFFKRIVNRIKKEKIKKFYVCFLFNLDTDKINDLRDLSDTEFKKYAEVWDPSAICRYLNNQDGYPEVWVEDQKQYIMIRYL